MHKLLLIFLFVFNISCQYMGNKNPSSTISNNTILNEKLAEGEDTTKLTKTGSLNFKDTSKVCYLDTLELKAFWNTFIKAVKTKNKKVIYKSLSSDMFLGPLIDNPKFMKDCDTVLFGKSDDKYGIAKLTEENFNQYFDSIFNPIFIELITGIKIDLMIKNGTNTGYSFVYNYAPSLKTFPCSHEKVVVINLFYCKGNRISINFCC